MQTNYFLENDKIAQKYIDDPFSLTKEVLLETTGSPNYNDKAVYWLKSYFYKTKPKDKDNYERTIGHFQIRMYWEKGILTNSGKNRYPTQYQFFVKDLNTGDEFNVGLIYNENNRRSRGGKFHHLRDQ